MSVAVTLSLQREFHVPADPERVFNVLADVPYSVSHFPRMERLADQGDGVFRWELETMSALGLRHQVVYTSRYVSDPAAGSVVWTPASGPGDNADISGHWRLSGDGGTRIRFATDGTLQIPAPELLAALVRPVVTEMFEAMIDEYLDNLAVTFAQHE